MEKNYEWIKNDFIISTDKTKINVDVVHAFLSKDSYWAESIPKRIVVKAIENSVCFGIYNNKSEQIGFARAVTDKATFAYVADVFVLPAYRGKGLSKWLMQCIHGHPELQNLRRWMLTTKDAHGLYAQSGWQHLNEDMAFRTMIINRPGMYKEMEQ